MVPEHGQAGPALSEHVHGVDRHDDGLRRRVVRHQDADPAVAEAHRVVRHPEEEKTLKISEWKGIKDQRSGVLDSPGPPVLVQVDPAG